MTGKTHSTSKGPRKTHAPVKGPSQIRGKRTDLIHLREMIFSRDPVQLEAILDMGQLVSPDDLDSAESVDELQLEATLDQEADLEIRDDDEIIERQPDKEYTALDYSTLLHNESIFPDSAALSTNTIYGITVTPANGRYHCWFEGPSWFDRRLPYEIRVYINKLNDFLKALAQWLEKEKQEFLAAPVPDNFVIGEADYAEVPVILQKGFLQRINREILATFPYATKEEFQEAVQQGAVDSQWFVWPELDEGQFSRLLDKIWILWPEWNMPLANIFSPAYHLPWLVEVGSKFYREAGEQWLSPELQYSDFGDNDMAVIKKKEFSMLTPEEKLHLLRFRLQGGRALAASALEKICARLASEHQGECHGGKNENN